MARRNSPDGRGRHGGAPSSATERADDGAAIQPGVAVVDDDPGLRDVLGGLLSSIGLRVQAFSSAQETLSRLRPERTNCLVLDVRLPDRSGFELHEDLTRANIALPVIFISGYADVRLSVRAMKAGAVDFLEKPFAAQELLDAVQIAIRRDQARRENDRIVAVLQTRFNSLTTREQEAMTYVVGGRRNKAIAAHMGVTEITVKAHRNHAMKKMGARSLAELIGMAQLLGHDYAQAFLLLPSELTSLKGGRPS
jgi:FixJ family two-component response regulator